MSQAQEKEPARKATVDDIVRELRWLNENFAAFSKRQDEQLAAREHAKALAQRHAGFSRAGQGIACGLVLLFAIGAAGSQSASGNLAELMAQNAVATKAIVPGVLSILAAIGLWNAIKSPSPS